MCSPLPEVEYLPWWSQYARLPKHVLCMPHWTWLTAQTAADKLWNTSTHKRTNNVSNSQFLHIHSPSNRKRVQTPYILQTIPFGHSDGLEGIVWFYVLYKASFLHSFLQERLNHNRERISAQQKASCHNSLKSKLYKCKSHSLWLILNP